MSGRPVVSGRALALGLALGAAFFALSVATSCGREQFDLLASAGAPSGGAAGQLASGAGAGAGAAAGAGAGAGGDPGGGNNRGGGGSQQHGAGGDSGGQGPGNNGGGGPAPCFAGEPCVDGGVSNCPPGGGFACRRCVTDAECPQDAQHCDPSAGRCVECRVRENDCAPGFTCDVLTLRCARACQGGKDCSQKQLFCIPQRGAQPDAGVCVECIYDSDCSPQRKCVEGYCVDCVDNATCPIDRPICQGLHCIAKH